MAGLLNGYIEEEKASKATHYRKLEECPLAKWIEMKWNPRANKKARRQQKPEEQR